MAGAFVKISGAMAACALGIALIAGRHVRADAPDAQSPDVSQARPAQSALQQANALIEQYVQPVAEQEPTGRQKQAIASAIRQLESEQAANGQNAIKQFVAMGPVALGDLRRLATTAPPENSTGENTIAETYPATMAAIIIRRIETAYREPILDQLISVGGDAHIALMRKLSESAAATTAAASNVEAATAALIKASAGTTPDAPALAPERQALAEAQAAEDQVQTRYLMLMELRRLMAPKPPAPPQVASAQQPQTQPAQQPPSTAPADVQNIQPTSPQTGSSTAYTQSPITPQPGAPYTNQWGDQLIFGNSSMANGGVVNLYSQRGAASRSTPTTGSSAAAKH